MVPAPKDPLRRSATDAMVRSAAGGEGGTAPEAPGPAVGLGVDAGSGPPGVAVASVLARTDGRPSGSVSTAAMDERVGPGADCWTRGDRAVERCVSAPSASGPRVAGALVTGPGVGTGTGRLAGVSPGWTASGGGATGFPGWVTGGVTGCAGFGSATGGAGLPGGGTGAGRWAGGCTGRG